MLKSLTIFITTLLFSLNLAIAQNPKPNYNTLISNFQSALEAKNFKDMKTNSEALIEYYPDDYAGYALNGYFMLCRGQNTMAGKQFKAMLQLNPIDALA